MLVRHLRVEEPCVFASHPWDDVEDGALPVPPLMEGLGRAHLAVSTRVPEAQAYFDQGLRLLHLGWGPEARRAFAHAARLDPELAMAWWGLALTRGPGIRFAEQRSKAIYRALALSERATDAEQRYIVAVTLLADKGPANGRHGFIREMEALIDRYPEDGEARLLLAGFMADGYEPDGRPCAGQPYAQALLRELLRTHPEHEGVHLAWVQAMEDSPRPEAALGSARRLRELAPQAGPALLVAGRLLQRLGHTAQGREVLQAAVSADEAWLEREQLPVSAAPAAVRALGLLVQACAEGGRYVEAQAWARQLRTRVEPLQPPSAQALCFVVSTLSSLHQRFGFWRAAAEVQVEPGGVATAAERGLLEGLGVYAQGLVALEAGRLAEVERACEALEALHAQLSEHRRAEGRALCPRDVAKVAELAGVELLGALECRRGEHARAEATLVRAVRLERRLRAAGPAPFSRPARETLARARLRAAREDKALELAQALVAERPGSGQARLLLAEVHVARRDQAAAVQAFTAFLERWEGADAHLPELHRARHFLAGQQRQPVHAPSPSARWGVRVYPEGRI